MTLTLQEFYDLLANHDWYYQWSDDMRAYRAGQANEKVIEALAEQSDEHKKLYEEYSLAMFSGNIFGCPDHPIPERPE